MELDESLDALPDAYRTAIFRVVQEALTNCAKHSHSTAIEISLHHRDGLVNLSISDNGIGLNGSPNHTGLGLIGMQERVRELGGWFSAKTRQDGGTILTAEIPAEVPAADHV
jgi:signal transduction histidine kinase